MNLNKRKYIEGRVHVDKSRNKRPYVVVYDWGVVRINVDSISEIVEYDSPFYFYTLSKSKTGREDNMDFASVESFVCFAFGKKLLLTEKLEYSNLYNQQEFHFINLETIIMNNGRSYITII